MRPSTLAGYKSMLDGWIIPFFGDKPLAKITPETVSDFFKKLREEKKASHYQRNMYNLLNLIFRLAWTFDLITNSPVRSLLHRPSSERKEKPTLPMEKAKKFFEALLVSWRAPILVLLGTGMRQGELLGLRWLNIDFDQRLITKTHVVYKGKLVEGLKNTRNNGRKRQHVVGMPPLVQHVLKALKEVTLYKEPEHFVLCREDGRPLDPDHIRRYVLYPAVEAAEIPIVKWGSGLHMFRHTVASLVLERTNNLKLAQEQLGHADIQTTANIYTHVSHEQKHVSANALQESFSALATLLLPSEEPSAVTN